MARTATSRDQLDQDGLAWRFATLLDPETEPLARQQVRTDLIEAHLDFADRLARRFANRGEPVEDLIQVARLGLLKAVDGYDPSRGVEFVGYAVPTIVGELKRHFRDKGWALRVPRRLKDLKLDVSRASATLAQSLGRMPNTTDLARFLKVGEDAVRECARSSSAYAAGPLSVGSSAEDGRLDVIDVLGDADPALDRVEDRESLRPLLASLPSREQRIIGMRFFDDLTQSQIAARIGISQMHVSRLLNRSLATMREGLQLEA